MRALIVSDVHANLAAFEAVLDASRTERDRVLCLGDLVGYGPDPDECVHLALETCELILAGNHDLAACGRMDASAFSSHARQAMDWTRSHLAPATVAALESLPTAAEAYGLSLSHGSPAAPVWGYILSAEDAAEAFASGTFGVGLFGHTHIPSAFIMDGKGTIDIAYGAPGAQIRTGDGRRFLLNPGSVGFPRDAADAHSAADERRAAARYALYDDAAGTWTFRRAEYDMRGTAKRMRKAGLW